MKLGSYTFRHLLIELLLLILSPGTAEAVNKSLAVSETIRLILRFYWEMTGRQAVGGRGVITVTEELEEL